MKIKKEKNKECVELSFRRAFFVLAAGVGGVGGCGVARLGGVVVLVGGVGLV